MKRRATPIIIAHLACVAALTLGTGSALATDPVPFPNLGGGGPGGSNTGAGGPKIRARGTLQGSKEGSTGAGDDTSKGLLNNEVTKPTSQVPVGKPVIFFEGPGMNVSGSVNSPSPD